MANEETGSKGLNDWRDTVHSLAVSKGWYENRDVRDVNALGSMLALIHSEVSEALEDVRTGSFDMTLGLATGQLRGLPSELADVIIRVLDMCGALGIDIEHAVSTKHAFNETRPHRHGGKAL